MSISFAYARRRFAYTGEASSSAGTVMWVAELVSVSTTLTSSVPSAWPRMLSA